MVNYSNNFEFTRITEFKHWTYQKRDKTAIMKDYSRAEGDPYYPIPGKENYKLYKKYADDAKKLKDVCFIGRLGKYKYQNMDRVVEESINLFKEFNKAVFK